MQQGLKSHLESMIEWIKIDRPRAIEMYGQDLVERAEGINALAAERMLSYFNDTSIDLRDSAGRMNGSVLIHSPLAAAG